MAAAEALLAFRGDNAFFQNAFAYSYDDITGWLKGQVDDTPDGELKKTLREIVEAIMDLSLYDGRDYVADGLRPDQHILRKLNEDWEKDDWKRVRKEDLDKSAYLVNKNRYCYKGVARIEDYMVPYWCPYDLLGLFLGMLGPAPAGANLDNFFIPMTAVYGQWCAWLAGRTPYALRNEPQRRPSNGAGDWPFCFQCTWEVIMDPATGAVTEIPFSLGASLGGYVSNFQHTIGNFRLTLNKARMTFMNDEGCPIKMRFKTKKSPKKIANSYNGTEWGNCAETYPFVQRFYDAFNEKNNRNIYGVALKRDLVMAKAYDAEVMRRHAMLPCQNCQALINKVGGLLENFDADRWF